MSTIENFLSAADLVKKELNEISVTMQTAEKAVCDLYHILEYIPLNAVQLMQISNELRAALKHRRHVKEQYAQLQSIRDNEFKSFPSLEEFKSRKNKREEKYAAEAREAFSKIFFKKNKPKHIVKYVESQVGALETPTVLVETVVG